MLGTGTHTPAEILASARTTRRENLAGSALWPVAFSLALFGLSSRSPIGELSEANLSMHMMVQHPLNLIPGLILGRLAAPWVARRPSAVVSMINLLCIALASGMLLVWHLPSTVEAAMHGSSVHALMHLSIFLLVGVPLGIVLTNLGEHGRIALLAASVPVGILGTIIPYSAPDLYPSYAPWQHRQMAWLMMIAMPLATIALLLIGPFSASLKRLWHRWRLYEVGAVLMTGLLVTMLALEIAGLGHFHMLD